MGLPAAAALSCEALISIVLSASIGLHSSVLMMVGLRHFAALFELSVAKSWIRRPCIREGLHACQLQSAVPSADNPYEDVSLAFCHAPRTLDAGVQALFPIWRCLWCLPDCCWA